MVLIILGCFNQLIKSIKCYSLKIRYIRIDVRIKILIVEYCGNAGNNIQFISNSIH